MIQEWFDNAPKGATHMIVVCDTFSYEDYPSYVKKGEDVHDKVKYYSNSNMQTVMEVYNLNISFEKQSTSERVFNY